jgi:hypothetical protein
MATPRERKCKTCNSPIELGYLFCPICGNSVVCVNNVTSSGSSGETSQSKSKGFSLESFENFKRQKESQRSSFFVRKNGRKSSSKEEKEVVIYIGLMEEMCQVKRGEWLPLKIKSSATADDILEAAIQKHSTFNKRFNSKLKYKLVFKDGSEVSNIPGVDLEESFVLFKYKELSGFSYGKIKLFLIHEITSFQNRIDQLKSCLEEAEDDELSSESEEQALSHNPLSCEINSVNSSNNDHSITNQSTDTETIEIPDEEAMTQSVSGNPPEKDGAAININVECPLCLKTIPIATVEQHADQCASLFQILPDGDDHDDNEDVQPSTAPASDGTLRDMVQKLAQVQFDPEEEPIRITVRRSRLWEDFKRARSRYYCPQKKLKVTFSGEPAIDDGGPKREFFSGKTL